MNDKANSSCKRVDGNEALIFTAGAEKGKLPTQRLFQGLEDGTDSKPVLATKEQQAVCLQRT
ncbi:MAG: hypothetical protein Q4A28_06960 [Brachymonas sp.]|nr:hypothetical protein [Brachymonas sp.]